MKKSNFKKRTICAIAVASLFSFNIANANGFNGPIISIGDVIPGTIHLSGDSELKGNFGLYDQQSADPSVYGDFTTASDLLGLLDNHFTSQIFFELEDGQTDYSCAIKNYISAYYPNADVIKRVSDDQSRHIYALTRDHKYANSQFCLSAAIPYTEEEQPEVITVNGQKPDNDNVLEGPLLDHLINTGPVGGGEGSNQDPSREPGGRTPTEKEQCAMKGQKMGHSYHAPLTQEQADNFNQSNNGTANGAGLLVGALGYFIRSNLLTSVGLTVTLSSMNTHYWKAGDTLKFDYWYSENGKGRIIEASIVDASGNKVKSSTDSKCMEE